MIFIVMGVSGCGKSSVAEGLAQRLGGDYYDADAYHPAENVAKMSQGIPLTDADRAGWLAVLAQLLKDGEARGRTTVLACSALKEAYRNVLRVSPDVRFVYLRGTFELIDARMRARANHFMNPGLLASQFQTLEEPACGPGTDAWAADITLSVDNIVDQAVDYFGLRRPS